MLVLDAKGSQHDLHAVQERENIHIIVQDMEHLGLLQRDFTDRKLLVCYSLVQELYLERADLLHLVGDED